MQRDLELAQPDFTFLFLLPIKDVFIMSSQSRLRMSFPEIGLQRLPCILSNCKLIQYFMQFPVNGHVLQKSKWRRIRYKQENTFAISMINPLNENFRYTYPVSQVALFSCFHCDFLLIHFFLLCAMMKIKIINKIDHRTLSFE